MEYQKALFNAQIEMSIKYDLPIIIHMRDASQDTYELLKEYETFVKIVRSAVGVDLEGKGENKHYQYVHKRYGYENGNIKMCCL